MGQRVKNGSRCKTGSHYEMGHSVKHGLHCKKRVTFGTKKMGHFLKSGSHCEKWVICEKMGHIVKIDQTV